MLLALLTPTLFLSLVLSGALTLLLALTLVPRERNKTLGFLLITGILLLFVPLVWLIVDTMLKPKDPPENAPPRIQAVESTQSDQSR